MSLLPRAVRFRQLAQQLDAAEFSLFKTQLMRRLDRQVLSTLLFSAFFGKFEYPDFEHALDMMLSIISTIINDREQLNKQASQTACNVAKLAMDSLPSDLIGE